MVVILKQNFTLEQMEEAVRSMEAGGGKVMVSRGSETTILGAEGDASRLDEEFLSQLPGVERVMRVSEPFKKANRKFHPDDSVIEIGPGVRVGGQKLAVIAGPCSVESQEPVSYTHLAVSLHRPLQGRVRDRRTVHKSPRRRST